MQLYRSTIKTQGGGGDYSATYTFSINGVKQKGSCARMFANNTSFNSPVIIGNNVNSCYCMFESTAMNQDITVPINVTELNRMLYNTPFGKNIYIKGKEFRNFNLGGLFNTSTKRKNILFHSSLNSVFNNGAIVDDGINLIVPTWTPMTNGFYNTQYNIYCYYNYSG